MRYWYKFSLLAAITEAAQNSLLCSSYSASTILKIIKYKVDLSCIKGAIIFINIMVFHY